MGIFPQGGLGVGGKDILGGVGVWVELTSGNLDQTTKIINDCFQFVSTLGRTLVFPINFVQIS